MADALTDRAAADAFFAEHGFTGWKAGGRFGQGRRPCVAEKCSAAKWSMHDHIQCWNPPKVTDSAGRGWCGVHAPAAVEKREAAKKRRDDERNARTAAMLASMKRDREIRATKDAALDALRHIAAGHNDPRALANEVLAMLPPEPKEAPTDD